MSYEVDTPVFAGPFDLLLHLILQDEVDLYQVSLGGIIEAYLAESVFSIATFIILGISGC